MLSIQPVHVWGMGAHSNEGWLITSGRNDMNTELGDLLNTYQKQITEIRTQQIVQDTLIKSIISIMPEEIKSQIHNQVKNAIDVQPRDEGGTKLKTIAQDYLERVFQIK